MVVELLIFTGIAIIGATVAETAVSYRELPERVPTRFGFGGKVNAWEARPAIWALPCAQLLLAYMFWRSLEPGLPAAVFVGVDGFLALMWRGQGAIIATATSGRQRAVWGRGYWLFFVFTAAVMTAAILLTVPLRS